MLLRPFQQDQRHQIKVWMGRYRVQLIYVYSLSLFGCPNAQLISSSLERSEGGMGAMVRAELDEGGQIDGGVLPAAIRSTFSVGSSTRS